MKKYKLNLLLAASLVVVLNFSSCGKYEDGPSFTLRSKNARLTGEWEVVKIGTQNITGYEVIWEFSKDGDWDQTVDYGSYSYTYAGDWEWKSSKEEIEITQGGSSSRFEILRLTNKELWLEDDQN
ncbi:MAG: hypothetical protein JKY54_17225 [Flavobacteriales bacterium]|nr:hypothetical protein [Flavobacteriales bacterium]